MQPRSIESSITGRKSLAFNLQPLRATRADANDSRQLTTRQTNRHLFPFPPEAKKYNKYHKKN